MIIGIDLGTTFSAVSFVDENGVPQIIANRDGERVTPSVILFEGTNPIVGTAAKNISVSDPLNVAQFVKRQMGNSSYKFATEDGEQFSCEELSAIILRRLKQDAEDFLGQEITKAVITVPAYFSDAQRKATQHAGRIAGLEVLKIINEPTAAALAYGLTKHSDNQNIMVYDLGGGTFDVTIMSINNEEIIIKGTGGDRNLGGFDFDNSIIDYVANEFKKAEGIDIYDDEVALQELREKAEACKKTLSSRSKALMNISSQGKRFNIEITREQFEAMIEFLIDRTIFIMNTVLEEAGLRWEGIDKILLVGGSTRVNRVSEAIKEASGKNPSLEVNPDEAVAIGAALQAAMLENDEADNKAKIDHKKIVDVNSHSLGVIALDDSQKLRNFIILKKNTPIPAEGYRDFGTASHNQTSLNVKITEGEDEELEYANIIGEAVFEYPSGRTKGSPIRILVSYDEDAIIHVHVVDLLSNKNLGELNINRKENLNEDDIDNSIDKISGLIIE